MRRILLYTHFNGKQLLADYVLYQLEELFPLFERMIFISNSELSSLDLERLKELLPKLEVIQRDNRGYDFSAWQEGLETLGWDLIANYDSLTLMNDTCYGPLFEMAPLYAHFEQQSLDFWGMTRHPKARVTRRLQIEEHVQSYFMVFHQSVLTNHSFQRFWEQISPLSDVQDVIERYEVGLTQQLISEGLTYDVCLKGEEGLNLSMERPDLMLAHKLPLIKIKSFAHRSSWSSALLNKIDEETTYPIDLIVRHLFDRYQLSISGLVPYLTLEQSDSPQPLSIHVHFQSDAGLKEIFSHLSKVRIKQLVITFEEQSLENQLKEFFLQLEGLEKKMLFFSQSSALASLLATKHHFSEDDHIVHVNNAMTAPNEMLQTYTLKMLLSTLVSHRYRYPEEEYGLILPFRGGSDFDKSEGFIIQRQLLDSLTEIDRVQELFEQLWAKGYVNYVVTSDEASLVPLLEAYQQQVSENEAYYGYKDLLAYFWRGYQLVGAYLKRLVTGR